MGGIIYVVIDSYGPAKAVSNSLHEPARAGLIGVSDFVSVTIANPADQPGFDAVPRSIGKQQKSVSNCRA